MSPERWERIQECFDRLVNLPREQRRQELSKLGDSDPELRREVETLLGSDEQAGDFLEKAVGSAASRAQATGRQRHDRIGQVISHYRIEERLGGGGMGVVYKAQDLRLDRSVALKFLPPASDDEDERIRRLIVEARAASALDHPNICTIHQIDQTDDGHWFIVMAYYNGDTLKKRIEGGPLPVSETLDIAAQIVSGLIKAHKEGIVHRDLKPANLMITHEGVVKIVDFGLAQLREQTKLTAPGTRLGTPAYMSPEQAQGNPLDHRTDIWSLGVVLYEMLAGRSPFKGDYELAIIYSILNEDPAPLEQLRPDAPTGLLNAVGKALAKDPDERFQQLEELLQLLERLKSAQHVTAPEATVMRLADPPAPRTPRKPMRAVYMGLTAAAAIVIAVLLAVVVSMRTTGSRRAAPAVGESAVPPAPSAPQPPNSDSRASDAAASDSAAAELAVPGSGSLKPDEGAGAGSASLPGAVSPAAESARLPQPAAALPPAKASSSPTESPAAHAAAPVHAWPVESRRWALVIGVEKYQDAGISPFGGAAHDAAAIQDALVRYARFPRDQVIVLSSSDPAQLRSPTRANIESYLENVARLAPHDGLVLFCFIGHATTIDGQPVLLPVDAHLTRGAIPLAAAVRLDSVRNAVRRGGVRQAMVLFDGFRQDPLAARKTAANQMSDAYARRLSLDPAAGEVDAFAALYAAEPRERSFERPAGGGYFASALVEGLKGGAADGRGRVTLGALDRYVRDIVPKRVLGDLGARSVQRPYAQIAGYVGDDVVVATPLRRELTVSEPAVQPQAQPQAPVPPPVDTAAQELDEWTRVRDSRDIAALEAFLRKYPDGALRKDAQARIEELQWEAARAANDPAVIERYLRDNPNSRYAGQAHARLEQLRPPPAPVPAPAQAQPQAPPAVAKVETRAPSDADAIRDVLQRYGEAYRARDVQQVAALWPSLTQEQLRRLADSFRVAVSIQQNLAPLAEPVIRGDQATVRCRRSIRYEDERGPQRPVDETVNVVLRKQQGSWVIQNVN